ncbi:MAG: AbgT family transporter [Candidatus Izemoplasmatales bacterium]|jgi:uncharacterized ion transporter superfamily protein YfcC|nr:AbgT family transporter [Candidatus Izemoplasmatales bacterium]
MEENKALININKRSFINVLIILFSLMVIAFVLTYLIPQGSYQRTVDGEIIAGTYQLLPRDNLKIWEFFYAPIGLLLSSDGLNVIMISLFLFILGGFFTVMDKSKGIIVIIKKLVDKYSHNKHLLIRIITLFFMLFGAFFGIFEESVALLPIMIILALSMGYDTLMAMGLTVLAAGFGFASAITNPFSVGIASEIAGINILSGVLFRVGVFAIMYFLLSTFLVNYAKKLEKNPKLSLTYTEDQGKRQNINTDFTEKVDNEQKIFKTYIIIFLVLLTLIILASLMQLIFELEIPTIVLMIVVFLFGGLLAGFIINGDIIKTLKVFWKGMLAVMPAAILIIFAGSVKYIMTSGEIMDTILYYFESILGDKPAIIGVLGIYLIILIIQFFIGSASAKAVLIMPILVPLVSLIGVSTNIAILAFIFGDGYTNVIFPTNGVLLIALSIASVSYQKWFKWTIKLQALTFILTIILLVIAYAIGY